MLITLNKNIISIDQFKLKCSVGKGGIKKKVKEGDNITPKGIYFLDKLYYRADRIKDFRTKLKNIIIKKNMGWSDDPRSKKYNRKITLRKNYKYSFEKLYIKDNSYDLLIPIKYKTKKIRRNKGSAIFIHLTNNYKRTLGCIALKENDLLTILKLINKKTKIRII